MKTAATVIEQSNQKIQHTFDSYGVNQLVTTVGIMSNKGLGQEVKTTIAPQYVELWSMRDAHGFFENKQVIASNQKTKEYIKRAENLWIKERTYQ